MTETARLRPDVVLLDLKLSDTAPAEGLDVCAALRDRHAQVSIVVLTTFLDQKLLLGALQRGASGYALKDVDAAELAPHHPHRAPRAVRVRRPSASLVARSLTGQPAAPARLLSERELEVVRLVARGATNLQAARDLYVSESTVKYRLRLGDAQARRQGPHRACLPGQRAGPALAGFCPNGPGTLSPSGSSCLPGRAGVFTGWSSDGRPAPA